MEFIDVDLPEGKLRVYSPKDIGQGWIRGYVYVDTVSHDSTPEKEGVGKKDETTPK